MRGPITDNELENDETWLAPACETAIVRALLSGQLPQLFFRSVEALLADLAAERVQSLNVENVIARI